MGAVASHRQRQNRTRHATHPCRKLPGLIKDLTAVTVEGRPATIAQTHPEAVNQAPAGLPGELTPAQLRPPA